MIRFGAFLAAILLAISLFPRTAAAQSLPEYSAGTAGTLGTAGASSGIGKSISGVVGNLEKTMPADASASKPQSAPVARRAAAAAKPKADAVASKPADPLAPPAPKYEDPAQIQVAISYDELLRRFGPPSMEITTETTARKLLYMAPAGSIHVEVVDGIVTVAPKPKS